MANPFSKKVILTGDLAPLTALPTQVSDFAWLKQVLGEEGQADMTLVDLGPIRRGELPALETELRQEVQVVHLQGDILGEEEPLGGQERQQHQELLDRLSQQLASLPQLQLVVLYGNRSQALVQRLLLRGVPMVLALHGDEQSEAALTAFYQYISEGFTVRQVIQQLERKQPKLGLRSQEIFYNPEQEILEWNITHFPQGPQWTYGLIYRANQWRALSWRLRLPRSMPLSSSKASLMGRIFSRGQETAYPAPAAETVRGRSRAVRRGAAKTREIHERRAEMSQQRRRRKVWIATVLVALGLAAIITPLTIYYHRHANPADAFGLEPCPFPEQSDEYRVVVFPFQIVSNCGPAADRFTDLVKSELKQMKRQGMAIDPRYQEIDNCPATLEEVMATADLCHSDLFIWGQYLRDPATQREYLKVHYVSANQAREEEFLSLAQLNQRIEGFAITRADSLLSHDVHQVVAWGMGIKHMQLEEYDRAIGILTRIETEADSLRSLLAQELTLAYSRAGRYEQARAYFDQLIALHPDEPAYYFDRAQMLALMNQPEEALADYEKVLSLEPNNLEALAQKGLVMSELGRFLEAKNDLDVAIAAHPDQPVLLAHRARILVNEKNYEAALADYDRSLAQDPSQARIFFARGQLLQQMGEEEKALADVQTALELNPDLIEAQLFRGDVLVNAEEWSSALQAFNRILENRITAEALARRGWVRENLRQTDKALQDYQQSAKLKPTHTPAWMGQARIHLQLEQTEAALVALERVVAQQPGHLPALIRRSAIYLDRQRWDLALADLDRMLVEEPHNPTALYRKAVVMLEQGRFEEAEALARQVEGVGENLHLPLLRGRIALAQGQPRQALQQFTQAKSREPNRPEVYQYEGLALLALEQLGAAESSLRKAISLGQKNAEVYVYLGDVKRRQGALKAAEDAYHQAIGRAPDWGLVYLRRASLYQQIRLLDSALHDFDRALALDPSVGKEAYLHRGEVKMELEQYNQALFDFNQAIREAPDDFEAYCLRGRLYQLMGNFRQAEEDLEQAENLAPQSPWPPYYLAVIYEDLGREAEALTLADQAIERDGSQARLYNLRGELFLDAGNFKEAVQDFTTAVRLDPHYPDAYDNLGDLHRKQGNYERAISYYNQAIDHNPNHDDALYHRGFVFSLQDKYNAAERDLKRSIEIRPGQGIRYATLAQIYARQQKDDPFFYYLDLALQNGYPESELQNDPAFEAYRTNPNFQQMVQ
mgnify:CR=1 FL=1